MKRSEMKGFSEVFKFTFTQAIRSKSFVVTMIIMIIFTIAIFPFMALIDGDKDKDTKSPIEAIYLAPLVKEDLPVSEALAGNEKFKEVKVKDNSGLGEYSDFETRLKETGEKSVILEYSHTTEEGYVLKFSYNPASKLSEEEVNELSDVVTEWLNDYKISNLNVDEATMTKITKEIKAGDISVSKYLNNEEPNVISNSEYQIVYALLMISYMIILMAANMVSSKIVEEKTNRIVEYLMTTIRPMALLFGKVVAMLLVTVGELSLMLAGGLLGKTIAKAAFNYESSEGIASIFTPELVKTLTAGRILICIIVIGLGILIYGLIAGLFAATVSKMDEVQQCMKVFQTVIIVSFLASIFVLIKWFAGGLSQSIVNVALLVPFTSVFILPGSFLIGRTSVVIVAASIAISVIAAAVLIKFVSLVYESVIVANGEPLKLKQMVEIAKGNFKSVKKNKEAAGK